ncbi:MAG: Gfo/Idh/MocA family oxidoreductase [Calditrichaeota bacterium]|nr:Gfo/Idh/MocA family oxidoreductase [Calditrichota bacterium]
MKQLIQYFRTGKLELIDAPVPKATAQNIVIASKRSLISVGTEKMLLDFGKASYLSKAKQQPDRVKQVIDKIKTEGLITTAHSVWSKLNEPVHLGYSNVGQILEAGSQVKGYEKGQRVVSNGPHAEVVRVPWTLTASVPENVADDEAAFTVPGAICLEGVRLLDPALGETIVVVGLGLLGQITAQILTANGCRVLAFDIAGEKVEFARQQGIEAALSGSIAENVEFVLGATDGIGADGVIITASASSEELLSQCALMSRKRGRIVLIGVIPITVPRNLFYEKELTFQVSSAYGPGRYDPVYEGGNDYPLPYVRWTAKRNMEAFLFLLQQKKINVNQLITHRFPFDRAIQAYETIEKENPLGIILEYKVSEELPKILDFAGLSASKATTVDNLRIGFIGVGNFAKAVLLPSLKKLKAPVRMIASSDGLSAGVAAKKFGIPQATSDRELVLENSEINTVFIATRHDSHASLVIKALENDKHVFVEKPLALNFEELKQVYDKKQEKPHLRLMVGFNRRFSPFSQKLKKTVQQRSDPISIIITVNAGYIPMDHWVHDLRMGGGRIIGEGCHFVDLARFLVGYPISEVGAITTRGHSGTDEDKMMILLTFEDGSQASVNYLANGNPRFPKERVEVFSSQRVFQIDNFKRLTSYGSPLKEVSLKQDKGHLAEIKSFLESIKNGTETPIPIQELFEVSLATLAIKQAVGERRFVSMKSIWNEFVL